MRLPAPLRDLYERWLSRRLPRSGRVVLNQKRIFIFPTGYGFFYLLVASLLFIGGINYENNLILALSFLLASLFLVAILHTYLTFPVWGFVTAIVNPGSAVPVVHWRSSSSRSAVIISVYGCTGRGKLPSRSV